MIWEIRKYIDSLGKEEIKAMLAEGRIEDHILAAEERDYAFNRYCKLHNERQAFLEDPEPRPEPTIFDFLEARRKSWHLAAPGSAEEFSALILGFDSAVAVVREFLKAHEPTQRPD